jgi:hypothetical protein
LGGLGGIVRAEIGDDEDEERDEKDEKLCLLIPFFEHFARSNDAII